MNKKQMTNKNLVSQLRLNRARDLFKSHLLYLQHCNWNHATSNYFKKSFLQRQKFQITKTSN